MGVAAKKINKRKRARVQDNAMPKLAEEQFRGQELLFNNIPEAVIVTDLEGNITKWNPAAESMFGYYCNEVLRKTLGVLTTRFIKGTLRDGRWFGEMNFIRKDGGEGVCETAIMPLRDKNSNITAVFVLCHDITESKLRDEKSRENEQRYRNLFESGHDSILLMEGDRCIDCNAETLEMFGRTRDQIIGQQPSSFSPKNQPDGRDSKQKAHKKIQAALQGKPQFFEWQHRRYDGSLFDAEVSLNAVDISEKTYRMAVVHDITKRKQAEEALHESKEEYKTLFDESRDAILITTRDGTCIDANQAAADLFGYTREEMTRLNALQLYVDAIDARRFQKEIERRGFVRDYEVKLRKKNGTEMNCLFTVSVRRASNGTILGYHGIIRDITERKRAEVELQQSLKKLKKGLESTASSLASAVEIKDPYTAGHQQRVTKLACAMATDMGLTDDQAEGVRITASLHDIGKIGVPAEILSKPGRLIDIEFNLIKNHPQTGYELLKDIEFPWPVAQIVLQHHERMDGSGYPQGLKSEDILLEARILAVADVVEAMASHRPYRAALGIEAALEEISKNKGILYDAEVVDACLKLFTEKGFKF